MERAERPMNVPAPLPRNMRETIYQLHCLQTQITEQRRVK